MPAPGANLWLVSVLHPSTSQGSTWGRHVAVVPVRWSQEACVGAEDGAFFQLLLWGYLPILQHHVLLSPHTATAVNVAPISHLIPAPLPPSPVFSLPSSFCSSSSPAALAHCVCVCTCMRMCTCVTSMSPPCPPSQGKNTGNKFIFHLKTERSICQGSICSLNCSFLSLLGKRLWSGQMAFRGSY